MANIKELGYAWRDRADRANPSDQEAMAFAAEQVIQQVRGLPPHSTVFKPLELQDLGEVEEPDGSSKKLWGWYTAYNLPVEY